MRKLLLAAAIGALGALGLAGPADAQRAIGDTGLTATVTGSFASDYLFRGISQTRSRPAWQGNAEIEHSSGVYVGAFLSNLAFQGTDARQELDVFGGYRVLLAGFHHSPNFFGRSGSGHHLEGGADWKTGVWT